MDPSDVIFPSSWDYRCEPPAPSLKQMIFH
jgi:hypothetical protein